jgi:protein-L-isoaspartate(D-aspartate) O-methyltransferase
MNIEQARFNMVEQQIRPWEVLDQRVLDLIGRVPRELFVPEAYRQLAFADTGLPIGHGQQMLPPKLQAKALQSLDVQPSDRVLEVGTGTGYLTALLAKLAHHVYSVELFEALSAYARQALAGLRVSNVTLELGDAAAGWERHAPYDVIVVTGSLPRLPASLREQLSQGGRLFAVVGDAPAMEALLITRVAQDQWLETSLFETEIPPLVNAPEPPRFIF